MTGEPVYKVLAEGRQPLYGSGVWTPGRWRSVEGPLVPCNRGIHYCRRAHLIRWLNAEIWVFEDGTPDEAFEHEGTKMVTRRGRIVSRVDTWNERTARLFAADCAERVLHLIPGSHRDPFVAAVSAARAFARGEIDNQQMVAAWAAAGDAARDAAWAAAGDPARAAARDAARAAAMAAAMAAAWAAAWAAAGDAAWDAERAWQTERLFDYIEGRAG